MLRKSARELANLVPRVFSLLREVEKGPWERGWIACMSEATIIMESDGDTEEL